MAQPESSSTPHVLALDLIGAIGGLLLSRGFESEPRSTSSAVAVCTVLVAAGVGRLVSRCRALAVAAAVVILRTLDARRLARLKVVGGSAEESARSPEYLDPGVGDMHYMLTAAAHPFRGAPAAVLVLSRDPTEAIHAVRRAVVKDACVWEKKSVMTDEVARREDSPEPGRRTCQGGGCGRRRPRAGGQKSTS